MLFFTCKRKKLQTSECELHFDVWDPKNLLCPALTLKTFAFGKVALNSVVCFVFRRVQLSFVNAKIFQALTSFVMHYSKHGISQFYKLTINK